ncbi:hypothetical protein PtA15_17A201 [Puccinia triticina]|uniref:YopX protein domain-containing protein n=1 Tax=Puccinia triticina TaxID=208348 RepID=A0ABY7D528_9BASI|nr:uncharacterized protein PtA15_17A201 [Puccinia triticina]WAQ92719.1 hypothetical protein PtA15_17A201 [Puccinia triticina]
MPQISPPQPNAVTMKADHESHAISFEGSIKIYNVHRSIRATYLDHPFAINTQSFDITGPDLSEFGHDLNVGQVYSIRGDVMINYDGDTVWEINPLLAAVTYPVLSPYPHDRLIVNVCGALMELLEYWDHDCDAAAYVEESE